MSVLATVRSIKSEFADAIASSRGQFDCRLVQQSGHYMAITECDGLTLWLAGPNASASRPMPAARMPEPGGWNRLARQAVDAVPPIDWMTFAALRFRDEIVVSPATPSAAREVT